MRTGKYEMVKHFDKMAMCHKMFSEMVSFLYYILQSLRANRLLFFDMSVSDNFSFQLYTVFMLPCFAAKIWPSHTEKLTLAFCLSNENLQGVGRDNALF